MLKDTLSLSNILAVARHGAAICGAPSPSSTSTQMLGCDDVLPGGGLATCLLEKLNLTTMGRLPVLAGNCASRSASAEAQAWQAQVEREVASRHGLALLERFAPRLSRWDLHPGVQRPPPHYFDCKHSSFAAGAFDAEVASLYSLLEERFGGGGRRERSRARR